MVIYVSVALRQDYYNAPPKTTCRLELLERRSMTAQGPSPGEAGERCGRQTTLASVIQSLNYWCLKPKIVESQTL